MSSIAPAIWGRDTWTLLHLITIKPPQSMSAYKDFFNYLRYILPCKKCQRNYTEHVQHLPIPNTKAELANWLIKVHNRVNRSVNKEEISTSDAIALWTRVYNETKTLKEVFFPVMHYFINSHPGYYKCSHEFMEAHEQIWQQVPLFFSHLSDSQDIKYFVDRNPPPVRHKMEYKAWFKQLQKKLNYKKSFTSLHCTDSCMV